MQIVSENDPVPHRRALNRGVERTTQPASATCDHEFYFALRQSARNFRKGAHQYAQILPRFERADGQQEVVAYAKPVALAFGFGKRQGTKTGTGSFRYGEDF